MKKIFVLLAVLLILQSLAACQQKPAPPGGTDTVTEHMTAPPDETDPGETDGKEDPNMISHWTFDSIGEGGFVADTADRKNGTAQSCTASADAIAGSSLLFQPSVGSHVSFGTQITNALKETGAVTVAFWYYSMTSYLQKPYIFYLSMEDGDPGFCVELSSTEIVVSCRSSDKETVKVRTFSCRGWGEWIHLAVSVDYAEETVRLFRNGTEIQPKETDPLQFRQTEYDPGTPLYEDAIGGFTGDHLNTKVFSGKIDEVYLFSKAASAEEIQALYEEGKHVVTQSDADRTLYAKLSILTGMGGTVLSVGSNLVLHNSDRCFLLPGDASAVVLERNGTYYAPLAFYETYRNAAFSEEALADMDTVVENGIRYLSLSAFASATETDILITETGRILLGADSGRVDDALLAFIDRYYDGELALLPVPEEDFYSSRTEVQYSDVSSLNISLGSPSILRLPDGNLLCSYDYNGKGYKPVSGGTNDTGVCLSTDQGKTWVQIALVEKLMWASLFCVEDTVYLVGRDTATAKLAIVRSDDAGRTWTDTSQGQIDLTVGSAHRAPTPVVIADGWVYIACEDSCNAAGIAQNVPTKRAYMMSAPVDADLLRASSWTKSNCVSFDPEWLDPSLYYGGSNTGLGFYEGNAVRGKDGTMYIILRVDSDPAYGLACMLKLSEDRTALTFERMLELPVGKDKFAIRYDETSGKYLAIGNVKTTDGFPTQRNVLAMYVSEDLVNWSYAATLISDNTLAMLEDLMQNYGYQYPDFLIVGDDLLLVVREASGNTVYYHNANYISCFVIDDFRSLLS